MPIHKLSTKVGDHGDNLSVAAEIGKDELQFKIVVVINLETCWWQQSNQNDRCG